MAAASPAPTPSTAGSTSTGSIIDYAALGDRLKAYRLGAQLQAEEVAQQLGVSRAVVYRLEKGEIVKIDTLERLAQLLGTSMASLLGVEVEYHASALSLFERMRQLESQAHRIVSHFEPISLLLTSDAYLAHLRQMLFEAAPAGGAVPAEIEALLQTMAERKAHFDRQRPQILSVIGLRELGRFVHTGLVGRLDLPEPLRAARVQAARAEVLRIAELMDSEPLHIQIGVVDDAMPSSTFQLFMGAGSTTLAVSPFRLGELPNVRNGIATITAAPEAVRLHEAMIQRLWQGAYKGREGAQRLRALLAALP